MPSEPEIVVIARPEQTIDANLAPVATAAEIGGGPVLGLFRQNEQVAANSFIADPEVNDEEIVVIGQRVKSTVLELLNISIRFLGQDVVLPCIGTQPGGSYKGLLGNLQIQATASVYGNNRAGQNLMGVRKGTGAGNKTIPVEINAGALKGYAAWPDGILFLVAHEVSHSFKAMREFNAAKFAEFQQGAGRGLPIETARKEFENTDGFRENEMRANSIAREMLKQMGKEKYDFNPKFGYANC